MSMFLSQSNMSNLDVDPEKIKLASIHFDAMNATLRTYVISSSLNVSIYIYIYHLSFKLILTL